MSFFDFFRRKPISIPSIEHPVFGSITLDKGKDGWYWMHDAYDDGEIAVSIDTLDGVPPTDSQCDFYSKITLNPDAAFALAAPLVVSRYEEFFRRPFPQQWRLALRLCGLGVPLDGVETNPWDISFECLTDNTGHIFTCYFINGQPSHASLDT
jgi:hypothetical protein